MIPVDPVGFKANSSVYYQPGKAVVVNIAPDSPNGYIIYELSGAMIHFCSILEKPQTLESFFEKVKSLGSKFPASMVNAARSFLLMGISEGWLTSEEPVTINIKHGSTTYWTPMHFSIELTTHCNHNCTYCYRDCDESKDIFIPTDKLHSALELLNENGVSVVELTGGEPTLHPDFAGILNVACRLFLGVGVISNGWGVTNILVDIAKQYSKKVFFQIDLDGHNSTIHDTIRKKSGSFSRATSAIKKLSEAGILTRVAMNITKENLNFIAETAQIAYQLNATCFAVSPVVGIGRATHKSKWSSENFSRISHEMLKLYNKFGDFIFFNKINDKKNGCGAGQRSFAITPNGDVKICAMASDYAPFLGNIFNDEYNNIFFKNNQHHILLKIHPQNEYSCGFCPKLHVCNGCIARPFEAAQSLEKGTESCSWLKQNGFL